MVRFIIIIVSLLMSNCVLAQESSNRKLREKVVTSTAYGVFGPEVSPAKAMATVIEQAKIDAIAKEFGTVVSETDIISRRTINGNSIEDFSSFGECDVLGEWIETIGDTVWNNSHSGNEYVYRVTLKGRIREWNKAAVDPEIVLLCNGTNTISNKLRFDTYFDGDSAYVSYKSPVDGYLAIFIVDDGTDKRVQRLLPYSNQNLGAYPIDGDREYIFFSKELAPYNDKEFVRRLRMRCHGEREINQLYFVFSTNPFTRPTDILTEYDMPNQLNFESFHKWLGKCRRRDPMMCVKKMFIEIIK